MPSTTSSSRKKSNLFIVLSGIFLTNAIVAELIGVKVFSLEDTLGVPRAQLHLLGDFVLDFNLSAGVVLWPIVFITTDIINEYYGKNGVRKISFLTAGFIAYAFVAIAITTSLAPADFWLDVNREDAQGNPFNIDFAFNQVYRQGMGIIVGSLAAFLLGQLLDVFVFQKLRRITGGNRIWLRATGSTLVSQLIDSYLVLFIAFYLLAPAGTRWSISQVVAVGIVNYSYKFIIAIAITPLLYVAHYVIDRYLGPALSEEMMAEASHDTSFF
ncbi:queuosine precursor transporter [Tunicatimonas pelagia]|uniref:queuosine precursor transporter n=1 Tax=Tunicatimonas pelagia TaxID=931531 RepID=UPI0026664BC6|nr:queuosine precursor transporter [Tunicatimonas pelagia]WKN41587.1 queuosine precursor transporter [Tunicatimonas pelagia]